MSNKALITGITGMVGSHLADYLREKTDWHIHGMCRWRSPTDNVQQLFDRVNRGDCVSFHYTDLNDYASLITMVQAITTRLRFSSGSATARRSILPLVLVEEHAMKNSQ